MKPWREIAVPNRDVLKGTFQQSEFAADISAVRAKKAPEVYQDARIFFERTFITEGMRLLLTQVAERLNGRGGEPVIQLQTAFGGGKTHTMLAVYHLATRECGLNDLAGVPAVLEQAGLLNLPHASIAVLDGNLHPPGQPWAHGKTKVQTLWGELAFQLGGADAFERVRGSDEAGTSPGKALIRELLEQAAPCVVLIDELVAWLRQFLEENPAKKPLTGGTYESNLSFVNALTEAASQVPNAVLLASLPESENEAGGPKGYMALKALEKVFGRVQVLWKPVVIEDAFEIIRRRLFEPIRDERGRDEVCAAFAATYREEGARLPSETQQERYAERLRRAYPIHPEIIDRLYEDWTTLEGFQRTRGTLKLLARTIHRLWKDQNKDLMLLPGSIPLYDAGTRNELTYHLGNGWDPVIDKDIDGERAEASEIDTRDPRFGAHQAARRVARTVFLGSAPASVQTRPGTTRGVERGRILLGCVQPGQSSAIFGDALNRLGDRLHYLNASGDRQQDGTRFWFDVRANLRREMEDRKGRFDEDSHVRPKIAEVLGKLTAARSIFDGVHVFTPHSDIPDDDRLRLVLLEPGFGYTRQETRTAFDGVLNHVRNNGTRPRLRSNRLVFVAPDTSSLGRLSDAARTALAWTSIVKDIEGHRLVIDNLQATQAEKERDTADAVVQRAARDCYKWVLCPVVQSATDRDPQVEAFGMNTAGRGFCEEAARVCGENELIIEAWSPIHLRTRLVELYWKGGAASVKAMTVWEDTLKYLYLPRLKNFSVFEQAVLKGASGPDFFGTAYGQNGEKFVGFKLGDANIQVDKELLLIEPGAAAAYHDAQSKIAVTLPAGAVAAGPAAINGEDSATGSLPLGPDGSVPSLPVGGGTAGPVAASLKVTSFFGAVDVSAASAKMKLVTLAEEIIQLLASDPKASVTVTVEISANFPAGAPDHIKRGVSENATQLGFKTKTWE